MTTERDLSDKLREEFGITESSAAGRRPVGNRLGTAGEFRALMRATRLSRQQFAARFCVPLGTVNYWTRHPTAADVYARGEAYQRLQPLFVRARELGLLTRDPGLRPKVSRTRPPRSEVTKWRCTQCGGDFRKKELELRPNQDWVHRLPEGGEVSGACGPVVPESARVAKPS